MQDALILTSTTQVPIITADCKLVHNANSDSLQSINVVLRMSRAFFLKSVALTPILLNLMEQGGLSAVRGKALITLQLICKFSPSVLTGITEKRLPTTLVRVLASIISEQETHPEKVLSCHTSQKLLF